MYEITYLTKEAKSEILAKEIKALDGKIMSELSLGQKQLAYPIKKAKEAYFTTAVFELEPEKIQALNRKLGLEEELLRFLIIKAPVIQPKTEKVEKAQPKKETAPSEEKKIEPKLPKKEKPKEEKLAMDEAERLKALDEKLNELLKE